MHKVITRIFYFQPWKITTCCLILLVFLILSCRTQTTKSTNQSINKSTDQPTNYTDWYAYGGDAGGSRYAPLNQINRSNVNKLQLLWTYRTGELGQNSKIKEKLTFEATPIFFEGTLFLSTAYGKVIALNPATGVEKWTYDPKIARNRSFSELASRGVSVWMDAKVDASTVCSRRIFIGTIDARLIALDAETGQPCPDFGKNGQINLQAGLNIKSKGDYQITSPPAIVNDLVVVGSSIGDNWHSDTGTGAVRAFDVRTGKQKWNWSPLVNTSEFKGPVGAANAWSIISADPARDMLFVPTTSPSPDFYGGFRPGDNRYANSIVALKASTGKVMWHFQTVHHDLWDYDIAAQPSLVELKRDDKTIPAVVQTTKTGNIFVLHRETGEPIFPIEERSVPQSDIPGEQTSPTQPFSTLPSLMPHEPITKDNVWGRTEEERKANREMLVNYKSLGIYTPPSLEGTLMYPGNGSGTNWGGMAFDPNRQLMVANTSRLITLVQLIPREEEAAARKTDGGYEVGSQRKAPYAMKRKTFLSKEGVPLNAPPWGTLAAVDLSKGILKWEIPLGESKSGIKGVPNSGGPMVTAGDLIFIGATIDQKFRAFDIDTGKVLWSTDLPLCAIATPMTYQLENDKQYVVISVGGHGKWGLATGDYVMAFALP